MKKGRYTRLSEAGEVSYLGLFFPRDHPTNSIIDRIRLSILNGIPAENSGISISDIYSAQKHFAEDMSRFDEQTPYFAQDVTKKLLGDSVRAVILVKGDFHSENDSILHEKTVLPHDLGSNPWPLFRGSESYQTIDDRVTYESVAEYIGRNKAELKAAGCKKLRIDSSHVFFFDNDRLMEKYGDGHSRLDLDALAADVIETNGYVGIHRKDSPNWNDSKKRLVASFSYRQKHSIWRKTSIKLAQYPGKISVPLKQNADIIACRYRDSEEAVLAAITDFKGFARVSRFELQEIGSEDYFDGPKENTFRSFNLVTRAISQSGSWPVEFQFLPFHDFHRAEIDKEDPAHHSEHKKRQRVSKKIRALADTYEPMLKLIFPEKEIYVNV